MMRRNDSLVWRGLAIAVALAWGCDDGPGSDVGADAASQDGTDAAVSDGSLAPDGPLDTSMNFFVSRTSVSGSGNLGGLAGADTLCQTLAGAAGASRTSWVAYLSVEDNGGAGPVNAIDRIGPGPWFNADGEVLAADKTSLHPTVDPAVDRDGYIAVKPADELFVDETGGSISVSQHDIFTGSNADGTVFVGGTCSDWTSNSVNDTARVGHTDTPNQLQFSPSWNSAHDTLNCSQSGVTSRGGSGKIYCFATD